MYVACFASDCFAVSPIERFPSVIDAATYCSMLNAIHGYSRQDSRSFRVWSEITGKWWN